MSLPRVLRRSLLLLLVAVVAISTGCGGDDSGDQDGDGSDSAADLSALEQELEESQGPVPFEEPGPAFDASVAEGDHVWIVAPQLDVPFSANIANGIADGLAEAGVESTKCDGKSDISEQTRCFRQGIGQDADAIVFIAVAPALLQEEIADANEAGIPVISQGNTDPGVRVPGEEDVAATATHCYSCAGQLMADFAIVDSGGEAKVAMIWASDLPDIGRIQVDAAKERFDEYCPDCTFDLIDAPFARWDDLTTNTQSILRADPDVNYILPVYDGMALFIVPGVHAAGAQDEVKVVSFNATPAVMDMLAEGDVVAGDVGSAQVRQGWGTADQILRVLADEEPADDIRVPLRLFTEENIGDIDLSAQESTWYGEVDYQAEYRELWGLE